MTVESFSAITKYEELTARLDAAKDKLQFTADKIKGGLVLDTREGTRKGGDMGPAVVPGDLGESLLVQAIRHEDEDFKMPPKEKLPDEVIADLERWVAMGAPDPRDGKSPVVSKAIEGRRKPRRP